MKATIFSFIPATERSMVASTRIARYLRDQLQFPLIWDEKIADKTDLDVLFIINGAYGFCSVLEELSLAILGAKRIVWVQNDYTIVPPINNGKATSPFRNAFVARRKVGKPHLEFWTTCERESKATALSNYINWNCLTLREKPLPNGFTHNDIGYYGSFRVGREKTFAKFFTSPKCRIVISSPSKKFPSTFTDSQITHCGPCDDLLGWLKERGLGLYLEDRKSHSEFHSPPNRFYEMLSAGLPMIFENEAGATLRRAGYNPADYLVSNALEAARMLEKRDKIKKQQYEYWYSIARAEHSTLESKIKAAYKQLEQAV
jgi:hypothetical protein